MLDIRKINVYHYTSLALIVTAISGLYFVGILSQFIVPLLLIPTVTGVADIILKRIKSGKWKYSPSGGITGLILAMTLSLIPIYAQVTVGLVSILQKHIIKRGGRHIFNPAAFGLLFAWIVFGSPPAWWAVATPVVILFLFSGYLIGRLPLSLTFYLAYMVLVSISSIFTTSEFSLTLINYPLLFFATVMVVEPRTSALTKKGMMMEGVLLALAIFAVQQFIAVDMFIPMLLLMNLFVHFRILK